MAEIVMPRLSDSMEEGTILTWIKRVGDEVAVGDELVEIETDKANMAYESDVAGTLTEILAQEGDTLAIGSPIAIVGDPGEAPTRVEDAPEDSEAETVHEVPVPSTQPETPEPASTSGERVKASPLARRIARDKGVDLDGLTGSGPGGRIVKVDVERAEVPSSSTPSIAAVGVDEEGTAGRLRGNRQGRDHLPGPLPAPAGDRPQDGGVQGGRAPLLPADRDRHERRRRGPGEGQGDDPRGEIVPSFNDMVVKACAIALRSFPHANGAYRDGRFELYSRVNVGVAVAAGDALVVPTVLDADRKGLREIAADTRSLAARVRDGSITPPELSGGTFTVSNLGMYGITNFSAVINVPQAAILAVGAIAERPVVRDGEITTAHMLGVTLSCDHRILHGAPAAEFLARIRELLEEPLSLAL